MGRKSKFAEFRKKKHLEFEAAMRSKFSEWEKIRLLEQEESKSAIRTMVDDLIAEAAEAQAFDEIKLKEKKEREAVIRAFVDDLLESIANESFDEGKKKSKFNLQIVQIPV